jgi:hypothetical protein
LGGGRVVVRQVLKTQRKLGGWCSWLDVWVGLLRTVSHSFQCEDVSLLRWFVILNSRKKLNGNLVGRALGIFGFWWMGGSVL